MSKQKYIRDITIHRVVWIAGSLLLPIGICVGTVHPFASALLMEEEDSIRYEYDDANRVIRAIYPDGTVVVYEYDKNGNLLKTVVTSGTSTEQAVTALTEASEHETTSEAERESDEESDHTTDRSSDEGSDRTEGRSSDEESDRTEGRSFGGESDRTDGRSSDEESDRTDGRSSDEESDHIEDRTSEEESDTHADRDAKRKIRQILYILVMAEMAVLVGIKNSVFFKVLKKIEDKRKKGE
mgnify:CR=1 FL=1